VILGYDPTADHDSDHPQRGNWTERQQLTLELAAQFLGRCKARGVRFEPLGVAQGWSPESYASAVRELQNIGYARIAIGGMVPLKTHEILASLAEIGSVRDSDTQLHLLGITRCTNIAQFAALGVTSFDSTSAFRQAFKDDKDNYHTVDRNYAAVRVPQVDGNPKLRVRIQAGRVAQQDAIKREKECLHALRGYDAGEVGLRRVTDALHFYEELFESRLDYTDAYLEALTDAPWKKCSCVICRQAGINVIIFRGAERNKRRGFHNLHVFRQRLDRDLETRSAA
jgi:hypothetical protein